MGLRSSGSYAKVWKIEPQERYTKVQISISKKNADGEYVTDFSGYVRFIGDAHRNIDSISEGDRIRIGDFDVSNSYNKETKTQYTNVAIFSFEPADGAQSAAPTPTTEKKSAGKAKAKVKPAAFDPESDDEDLPF